MNIKTIKVGIDEFQRHSFETSGDIYSYKNEELHGLMRLDFLTLNNKSICHTFINNGIVEGEEIKCNFNKLSPSF